MPHINPQPPITARTHTHLHKRMQEGEAKQQRLEGRRLGLALKELGLRAGQVCWGLVALHSGISDNLIMLQKARA